MDRPTKEQVDDALFGEQEHREELADWDVDAAQSFQVLAAEVRALRAVVEAYEHDNCANIGRIRELQEELKADAKIIARSDATIRRVAALPKRWRNEEDQHHLESAFTGYDCAKEVEEALRGES